MQPIAGDPVLLDPRVDDPLEYLTLSLGVPVDQGGYRFVERPAPGTRAWERAHYTIKALGLNRRNDVIEGRADAYEALRRALDEIQSCLEHGRSLDGPRSTIRHTPHRSVWEEMKRSSIAEIGLRFARVPTEVLDW